MSLRTILRVEDERGKGPYLSARYDTDDQRDAAYRLAEAHSDMLREARVEFGPDTAHLHPGADVDLGWRWERMTYTQRALDYRFGFQNETRLRQWFFGERDTLELLNMHVAAYEVPHQAVLRGQWQVAFRQQSARRVSAMTLQEAGIE